MTSTNDLRDQDFVNECMRHIRRHSIRGDKIDLPAIISHTLESPAPGYYVSFDTAYRRILKILKHGIDTVTPTSTSRLLYRDLAAHVQRTLDTRPGMSVTSALSHVLSFGRAPRFYLSHGHAYALIRPRLAIKTLWVEKTFTPTPNSR